MTRCYPGKILQVINALSIGGAEKLLVEFAIAAKEMYNWDVDILMLFEENAYHNELSNAGIRVFSLRLTHKYDIRGLPRLIKTITEGRYTCINVHLFPASFYMAISTLFMRIKATLHFTEHNIWNRRRSFWILKLLDLFIYSRFRIIICVSDNVRKALLEWLPSLAKKVVVINNAVALPRLDTIVKQNYDLIFVGRLVRAKGVDILLDAIAELKTDGVSVKGAIVGDGPLRPFLENKTKELGLEKWVEFLGLRKDVPQLMKQSRIFVLPSRWEGLPLTLLEAMGIGIPIIATAVGGITDVIQNGETGILIEKEDTSALKHAIRSLLSDSDLRSNLARNASIKFREKYSMDNYVRRLHLLYFENEQRK